MRRRIWLILVLLGLPYAAAADTAGHVAARAFSDHEAAAARSETPVTDRPPNLDLRIGPPQLPLQSVPSGSPALGAEHDDRSGSDSAERGLSFGFELKRRRQPESRAWVDDENVPGLQDDIERLIDRSALGVRGTYRF